MTELTSERLKELVHYDKETGLFFRKLKNNILKIKPSGSKSANGYLVMTVDCCSYYAHRLAWLYCYGHFPEQFIDHINNNRIDNRIENLRDVSKTSNNQNIKIAKKNNQTKTLGVSKTNKKTPYRARIFFNGKAKYIGAFSSIKEAQLAYFEEKRKHHIN